MRAAVFDGIRAVAVADVPEPRVEEPGVGLIPLFAYFGPYEEMRLQKPCRAVVPPCAHAVAQRWRAL